MAGEGKPKENASGLEDASSSSASALLSSYLGLGFAVFLGFLPNDSISYLSSIQSRNRILAAKLFQVEDQLRQLRARRREDAKANARVVEIFAGQRHAWQKEERRLLLQIDAAAEEIAGLRARVAELEDAEAEMKDSVESLRRQVSERDEMLDFMARGKAEEGEKERFAEKEGFGRDVEENGEYGGEFLGMGRARVSDGLDPVPEAGFFDRNAEFEEMAEFYAQRNGYGRDFLPPAAAWKPWMEKSGGWQDVHYDSVESMYQMKHFIARRDTPWKVDGESAGVSSKLKFLEQELLNLEKVGQGDLSRIPSLMRKQAKRYQSLAGKIDDLCRRMQASDPCDPNLGSELRTQRQTEFLLEAFRLQHRATETRQKLNSLQTETVKSHFSDELPAQAKLSTRRSLDSIRNNLKEIQRNLEIWLARIMGDLEGILSRDGASRLREYYMPPYPFVR